ncbi:MAG: hypothetical protein U5L01_05020 [Rheinheimera sp.]|nr:hypothetical protein [Rheinheimera sp.]
MEVFGEFVAAINTINVAGFIITTTVQTLSEHATFELTKIMFDANKD